MLKISLVILALLFLASPRIEAIESTSIPAPSKAEDEIKSPTQKRFSDVQLSRVAGWVRERAPACPPDAAITATVRFLEELSSRFPEAVDHISTDDFPMQRFESLLLRHIAASVSSPQYSVLREDLARKRIEAVLTAERISKPGIPTDSEETLGKIKSASQVYYRRLVEGRIEDDDLVLLLKRVLSSGEAVVIKPQLPKILSATDIVSEFVRRNQVGSAVQRLRGYSIDGTLKTATGETQHLILFRLRPDRFRLVVKVEETTQLILASNGREFWQLTSDRNPIELSREAMRRNAYLSEFINPLFSDEGYTFEKLDGTVSNGIKVHRLRIRRPDGSDYISSIDAETFREVVRETTGTLTTTYSDFRDVDGVTFAFRETMKDEQGRTAVLEINRITPNPGVVQSYFEPAKVSDPGYFALEQWMSRPAGTAALIQ